MKKINCDDEVHNQDMLISTTICSFLVFPQTSQNSSRTKTEKLKNWKTKKLKNWKTKKLKNWKTEFSIEIQEEILHMDSVFQFFSFSVFQFFSFSVFQFWFGNYSGMFAEKLKNCR